MPERERSDYSLSDALKSVSDAVWVVAPDSTVVYANDAAVVFHANLYGTKPSGGTPVSDLYPADVRSRWTERYRCAADGQPASLLETGQINNQAVYYEVLFDRSTPTTVGYPVVVIAREVTARHLALLSTSHEARAIVDADTYVVYAGPRLRGLLGLKRDVPIRSLRLGDLLDPEDEPKLLKAISDAGSGPRDLGTIRIVDHAGLSHECHGTIARTHDTGSFAVTLLDVSAQIQTERNLERYAEHLRVLHTWAAELNASMDQPDVLYNRSLELLRNTVRYDSASIQILAGDELRIVASAGFDEGRDVIGLCFPFDNKFPNWHVVTSREPVGVADVTIDYPHFRAQADDFQSGSIAAWLGVPLTMRGEVLGMVALDRSEPIAFTDEEQRLVTTMAGHISAALYNSELYAALQESEQGLAETNAQKEVLLREIHHRSKNNMQMISSLLSLGAATVSLEEDSEVLDEVRMRIQSLAAIHEELYRADNLDSVDLAEYAKRLIRMIAQSYGRDGVRIGIDADEVRSSIDVSVPFGLILSELVLNAYKHAFPNEREGTIAVDVSDRGETARLVVKDDGIGMTRDDLDRAADSLGMQLVRSLVEQVEGKLDLANGPGTRWVVDIPVRRSDDTAN